MDDPSEMQRATFRAASSSVAPSMLLESLDQAVVDVAAISWTLKAPSES